MPLSQQLKSEMTGIPADASKYKESEQPVVESVNMPDFSRATDAVTPVSETDAVSPSEPPVPTPDQMSLLLSIESQLKGLNDNILSLGQAVADSRHPDFRAVFAKIDAARMSIENLIPTGNAQPVTETENSTSHVLTLLQSILEKQEKNDRQLAQTLRDNANFQIQVRQGMQRDLDKLKEQMNGEQFNPLLKEIASIYIEYQSLLDDETISDRSLKNLQSLFEQLEDMLSDYDAEVCRSEPGSVRQTRICKIIEKIPTAQPEKHNTIAASRGPGVVRDRTVLYPEFVDVFIYDSSLAEAVTSAAEEVQENKKPVACEVSSEETVGTAIDTSDNDDLGGNE